MNIKSLRILFVDDDEAILRSMSRQFSFCLDITTAYSAEEAILLMEGPGYFDIMVVDVTMPGMNGLDLIEHATQQCHSLRFIVLTGNTDQATFARAGKIPSICRILSKPASSQEILDAIEFAASVPLTS